MYDIAPLCGNTSFELVLCCCFVFECSVCFAAFNVMGDEF